VAWNIEGRTVVVTGANSGIGLATATGLARRGAAVTLAVRDPDRGRAAADRIAGTTGTRPSVMTIDLSSFDSVRSFVDRIRARHERVDVLINNAGVFMGSRRTTTDGHEWTMAVNHLGPFLLTCRLAADPRTLPERVITVASALHSGAKRDPAFDSLEAAGRYRAIRTYARSKLANVLFVRELARRLAPSGSAAFAAHPGMVATRITRDGDSRAAALVWRASSRWMRTPEQGAATSVYLATEPGIESLSGSYFVDRRPVEPDIRGRDDTAASRLWDLSARATDCTIRSPHPADGGTVPER